MADADREALKSRLKSDPKYGDLKAMIEVALEDVLSEKAAEDEANREADDTEAGLIDTLLGVFSDKKPGKKK